MRSFLNEMLRLMPAMGIHICEVAKLTVVEQNAMTALPAPGIPDREVVIRRAFNGVHRKPDVVVNPDRRKAIWEAEMDRPNGRAFYDAVCSGEAVLAAEVTPNLALTVADFAVIG